ncbi:uncharacterized protein [Venturia canescens]|uniref:uncharacterized protein n=1 Tax=Venturia canescens TaxID=32260 RepID=UPI001C9C4E25|nr:uncharacterized protein LOC122407057 [Venturia canescens]
MQRETLTHLMCIIPRDIEFNQSSKSKSMGQNEANKIPISPVMSIGRATINVDSIPDPKKCLCNRPQRTVVCSNCGFKAFGRIHYICAKHPGTSFLLDWPQCPHCRGYCLSEY